jgi:ABC-type transport system substrate-binding protein
MLLARALSLSTLLITNAAASTNTSEIFYCPYDVKLASPNDPKSLDLTYTPTNAPVNSFMFNSKACLLEVHFFIPDARGDVYLETIEYKSNEAMTIETKLAFNAAYAPVKFPSSDKDRNNCSHR